MATAFVSQASTMQRAAWFRRVPRSPAIFATVVTAIAGYFDAVGYVQLGHLYVSFMSGNSTHLGMSLAAGAFGDVILAAFVVGAFVIGACLGTIVADRSGATRVVAVLLAELLVLLVALGLALSVNPQAALTGVAAAMGMQNAVHQLISGADVGRSFITGALFSLGQALAKVVEGNKDERRTIGVLVLSWLAFVFGVVIGSLTFAAVGLQLSLMVGIGMVATTTAALLLKIV
jgi:uncharacterized membrane protein YoaK (UPF0700 family)